MLGCERRDGTCSRPFLDIDLGNSTNVSAISTQGAAPPVRVYPTVVKSRSKGFYIVEGQVQKEPYEGRFWNVWDPEWRAIAGTRHAKLRFVRSYELWWRADGGRTWNLLGILKGNDDATTAKAHLLTGYHQMDGLCCRYFRFVPIDVENGGAMRIGIYGARPATDHKAIDVGLDVRNGPTIKSDDSDLETMVEYRLLHPSPVKVLGAMQRDIFCSPKGKSYKRPTAIRFLRAQQAKKEAQAFLSTEHIPLGC